MSAEVPIKVVVRVRPFVGEEMHSNVESCLFCVPEEPVIVIGNDRHFTFDHVFNPESTQTDVYSGCVQPLISAFFEGYNATVFTYGQTGSGKTYTMGTGNCTYLDEDERGIIPCAVSDIFTHIQSVHESIICKLRVSFIEIYREETTDLLENSTKNLQIREDENGNTVVAGVLEEPADSFEEVLNILDAGTAIRHVGATHMNEISSRSHCIFTLILGNILSSRFHFVDLAGSERAHRTGNKGERFKESVSINTGLLALSNVICALTDTKRRGHHVPYRESKLTRLLKDSLGGNSRTVMITCLSPALCDLDENINSLKYASRARAIKNKPKINWDIESSKVSRMQTKIDILKSQLKRRNSDQSEMRFVDDQKINELELENERHKQDHYNLLTSLHEVNCLLQAVEVNTVLPSVLTNQIIHWRKQWENNQFDRPVTAPTKKATFRRPQNDVIEHLRSELDKSKHEYHNKCHDMEELRQEMIVFGEENAKLRLELDIVTNKYNELQEKLYEQQIKIQEQAFHSHWSYQDEKRPITPRTPRVVTEAERLLQSFHAKSNLLISQMDDMEVVEHDQDISSDEENQNTQGNNRKRQLMFKENSEPSMSRGKRFTSNIPRPVKLTKSAIDKTTNNVTDGPYRVGVASNLLNRLKPGHETAKYAARIAGINMRNTTKRLKDVQLNIKSKEGLIYDLMKSEQEAQATCNAFSEKLSKLQKEFEKSKLELAEAQTKVLLYEQNSNDTDSSKKTKLDHEYKKKLSAMQKKYDLLKQKQSVQNRLNSYQENHDKKIKDLEACISRLKNQYSELERKLKIEEDTKNRYEHDLYKNDLKIKDLELKTNQQQKLLKRKTEEVVSAQRKLRNVGSVQSEKISDHLEKKKLWIDNEIEKIVIRQKQIDQLEKELHERDESLRKKEALISERDKLQVKKVKSSQTLSKNILQLSMQMETIDEQIKSITSKPEKMEKMNEDLKRLMTVKNELNSQKNVLEERISTGGLDPSETRRLIELGEALEAVDEAINYKNDLINQKQTYLNGKDIDHYKNVDHLLNDMGDLTLEEYKHLLTKMFIKIIELRSDSKEHEDARCHFELKISEQEKQIYDLENMLQVIESRCERQIVEINREYQREMQFLVEHLRVNQMELLNKDSSTLMTKIKSLEKDLYYYKVKTRKLKDQLKDFTNDVSMDPGEMLSHTPLVEHQILESSLERSNNGSGEDIHFPPVVMNQKITYRMADVQHNMEHQQRLQEIFDSKPPVSPKSMIREKKDDSMKKLSYDETLYTDSIEVKGKKI